MTVDADVAVVGPGAMDSGTLARVVTGEAPFLPLGFLDANRARPAAHRP